MHTNLDAKLCAQFERTIRQLKKLKHINFYITEWHGPVGRLALACLAVPEVFLGISKNLGVEDLMQLKPELVSYEDAGKPRRYIHFTSVVEGWLANKCVLKHLCSVVEKAHGLTTSDTYLRGILPSGDLIDKIVYAKHC